MMGKYDKYSSDVRLAISYAREEAQRLRHRLISSEHLLLGILKLGDTRIEGLFACLHVSTASISQALDFVVGRGNRAILSEPLLNSAARAALVRAEAFVESRRLGLVDIEHVFMALLEEQNSVTLGVLESFGVQLSTAREQLSMLMNGGYERLLLSTEYYTRYEATPLLNQVSHDLTIAALNDLIDPLIGREAELERTMQILLRRTKNNPALIGPAGVGKTAIAEGLALRIIHGQVPENLAHHRIVALNAGMLSAGTKFRGDLEERLKIIFHELHEDGRIIVVIDELHTLMQTGVAAGSLDIADLFKPMLARGEFQCIGATTLDEYRKTIESDAALERRFQTVLVSETTAEQTLQILEGVRTRYEVFHQLTISDDALLSAIKMSTRYIQDRYLPDKALDLLDEAAARVRVQSSVYPEAIRRLRDTMLTVQQEKDEAIGLYEFPRGANLFLRERSMRHELELAEQAWRADHEKQKAVVDTQDVAEIVALWTGIPVAQIAGEERFRLLRLEHELSQRVIGQREAVQAVARAVRRSRIGLCDSRRPFGSFIFVGPTGVGKTELARALAATLFDDENALLKFDMSEFMESHQISRLISAPPGYVGHDQAGQLTEAIRRRPYSVVLFDEIEKAHPNVYALLLQILEDGCLTDARGRMVDFKHTFIILTSNIGTSHTLSGSMTFTSQPDERTSRHRTYEAMRKRIIIEIKNVFQPELFNRIDEIVVFRPLSLEQLRIIVDLMIAQTQQHLAKLGFELQMTEAALQYLIAYGYNADYGARPLRRAVQSQLDDLLAEKILRGQFVAGDSIVVDLQDDRLVANVQAYVDQTIYVKAKHTGLSAA